MHNIPEFKKLFTKKWLDNAIEYGSLNPNHGSDLDYLVQNIQHGISWLTPCPEHIRIKPTHKAMETPEMKDIIWEFLEKRYDYVMRNLPKEKEINLYRFMKVEDSWISKLIENNEDIVTGIYYSENENVEGDFWMEENANNTILIKAIADTNNVNWKATLLAKMDYMIGDEEAEITMLYNSDIFVKSINIYNHDTSENTVLDINRKMNTGHEWIKNTNIPKI